MFKQLPAYLQWSTEKIIPLVHQADSEEVYNIASHLLAAERIWAERIINGISHTPVWPGTHFNNLPEYSLENVTLYNKIIKEHDLSRIVEYSNTLGTKFESSVEDILLHVISHGQYHRGQLSILLRKAGFSVPDTDYIFYRRD